VTAQTQPQKTTIVHYTPSNVAALPTEQGTCWTNSIAVPYRADTWRCMVGNAISDPCFTIANTNTLLCNPDPTDTLQQKPFILNLTEPLPIGNFQPDTPTAPWGWLIQLTDGTVCTPFTGARTILDDGTPTTYGCNNPAESTVFGDLIDNGNGTWSATVGTISTPTNSTDLPTELTSQQVIVQTVWQ
jgi:hypothetical protein